MRQVRLRKVSPAGDFEAFLERFNCFLVLTLLLVDLPQSPIHRWKSGAGAQGATLRLVISACLEQNQRRGAGGTRPERVEFLGNLALTQGLIESADSRQEHGVPMMCVGRIGV